MTLKKDNPRGVLPYGTWITKILLYYGINLENEPFEVPKRTNAINKPLLQRMKINLEEFKAAQLRRRQGEQAQGEQSEPQPEPEHHTPPASPISQPTSPIPPTQTTPPQPSSSHTPSNLAKLLEGMEERIFHELQSIHLSLITMHERQDKVERELKFIKHKFLAGHHSQPTLSVSSNEDPYLETSHGTIPSFHPPEPTFFTPYDSASPEAPQSRPPSPILYPISAFQLAKSSLLHDFPFDV